MIISLIIIVLTSCSVVIEGISAVNSSCPSSKLIKPCRCDKNKLILKCSTERKFSIEQVFAKIFYFNDNKYRLFDKNIILNASNYEKENENENLENIHLNEFYSNPLPFLYLHENFFNGLRLKRVKIINSNLIYVNRKAFISTANTLKSLILIDNQLMNLIHPIYGDLFAAIKTLKQLQVLILQGNQLSLIPNNAFAGEIESEASEYKSKLWYIDCSRNRLQAIGEHVFANLDYLTYIDLSYNQLTYLNAKIFEKMSLKGIRKLTIFLNNNYLHVKSFDIGLWLNVDCSLEIYLQRNLLTTLNQTIFEPILNRKKFTFINIDENNLICDCNSRWLWVNSSLHEIRVKNFYCNKFKLNLWNLTQEEFLNCSSINESNEQNNDDDNEINEIDFNMISENKINLIAKRKCLAGYYECIDGACISLASVCDTIIDCNHGDDEANCKQNAKPTLIACVHNVTSFQDERFSHKSINIKLNDALNTTVVKKVLLEIGVD